MSDPDIVIRLRRFDEGEVLCGLVRDFDGGKLFHGLCLEAANEIERLREALRIEQEELAACCIDRKETQRERDEARREVCVWSCRVVRADRWMPTERVALGNEEDVAKSRGWDCFEDENK